MSTITNANAGVSVYLALRDKDFSAGLEGASSRLAAFAQRCQGLSQQIGIVSQSINVGLAAAVRQFAAFDDQMRMVAGITGSAGSEFENLTQLAQKLGRETSFTAAQVAGGMVALGRMGFDSGEIKDSIKSVMDLSRATGTDLVQASEIAGNAIGRTLKQIADPKIAAKLAEMGVATTGVDGNLRKLKDILVDIARVSSTMKSGEQIAFFKDIFNARGSLAGGCDGSIADRFSASFNTEIYE